MESMFNNVLENDSEPVRYAPCQLCGCYHRVKNKEEICCHCECLRTRAHKKASSWVIPR